MKTVRLLDGTIVPAIGQGTWTTGEDPRLRAEEIATLREGIDRGASLIDTAEMYGEGASEDLVGEAIAGRRDEVFLVSKVYPWNASRAGTIAACERSLKRLRTDRIDLYLLHWRGEHPLAETVAAFEALKKAGKIRRWGVSNFDHGDMDELMDGKVGGACATDQVLYNLSRRGIEWDLLPWARSINLPIMAYSPLEQARLLFDRELKTIAEGRGVTAAQLALAWVVDRGGVIAIPKASSRRRLAENLGALDVEITPEVRAALDLAFPPPHRATPLEML
ncbi:aldo/keto reductase [Pinisolibacter aquiterrae]|uniref:aldo/keto reductase n=1 Tax=Pinisolibacter aquiterrae TaxID=2815579 RepID=UPI001C3C90DD|nr:aldo/keto reductase [Pinisolibacter aquiterrae]MBV5262650.1 aldo/keto reductase [Pinisolibacter aquiterrae]MCC8236004.1 aldo/keto reductase [Pinisolibacter aquiterrae]